jgi:hypothetical protein
MVYSRSDHVFILEHYFASKSFTAVSEAFSNAYPDKEVPNKTIIRVVTKFQDTGNDCDRKHVWRRTVLTGETLRNTEETPLLHCKNSLMKTLLGVAFGHRDLQTYSTRLLFV